VIDSPASAGVCSVTQNLAAALVQQGQDVLLLDECSGPQSMPLARDGRLVLVNAVLDPDGALSTLAASADHILVVVQANAQALTHAYLGIKKLHYAHALQHLRVLVNAADDPAQAQRMLANLATTGSRYLGLALQPAGFVRADPLLAQASRLNLTVVQAFRTSSAARDFCRIAADLLQWPRSPAVHHRTPLLLPGQTARPEAQAVASVH
ncbi:MAG: flagellar biosynthesis protein FlhG, partial [Polaromonas sp.]|nr:flagellar biosynthesis protein FlhG [Polaromonas sp.]